jgi:hypothetical protein
VRAGRSVLAVAVGASALAAFGLSRTGGFPGKADPGPPPAATAAAPRTAPDEPRLFVGRNPFRYEPEDVRTRPPAAALPAPEDVGDVAVAGAPPPRVRLVGLVRAGGELKAALSIDGEVVLLAAGGGFAGYEVLAVDEDRGVRVRAPSGEGLSLGIPPP